MWDTGGGDTYSVVSWLGQTIPDFIEGETRKVAAVLESSCMWTKPNQIKFASIMEVEWTIGTEGEGETCSGQLEEVVDLLNDIQALARRRPPHDRRWAANCISSCSSQ